MSHRNDSDFHDGFLDARFFPITQQHRMSRSNPAANYGGPPVAMPYEAGNLSADGPAITPLREDQLPVALRRVMLPGEQGVLVTQLDRNGRAVRAWVEPVVMTRVGPVSRAELTRLRVLARRGCIEGRLLFYLAVAVMLLLSTVLAFVVTFGHPTTPIGPIVLAIGYLLTAAAAVRLRKVVAYVEA